MDANNFYYVDSREITIQENLQGINFINEDDIVPSNTYFLNQGVLPYSFNYGMRSDLSGKSVALVGNGDLENCGKEIDSHDHVIRITGMRSWTDNPIDSGERMSIWTGQLCHVVTIIDNKFKHFDKINYILKNNTDMWITSPFHISINSYLFLKECVKSNILIAPSPYMLYKNYKEVSNNFAIPQNSDILFISKYFETLLTGTRIAIYLEMCGVTKLSMYGFNLFTKDPKGLFNQHIPSLDHKLILNLKSRFEQYGKDFYWKEYEQVKDNFSL